MNRHNMKYSCTGVVESNGCVWHWKKWISFEMDEKCETVNEQVEKFRHIFRALFHFQIAIHKNTLEIFGKIFEKKKICVMRRKLLSKWKNIHVLAQIQAHQFSGKMILMCFRWKCIFAWNLSKYLAIFKKPQHFKSSVELQCKLCWTWRIANSFPQIN